MYKSGRGQKALTIDDVARHAGVSRAAVSKVLRNAYGVSESMKARVNAAIEELDYRPSVAARTMRGSSFTIGVEMPELDNPFLAKVLNGITRALSGTGYQVIVAPTSDDTDAAQSLAALYDRQVDGIIAIAPLATDAKLRALADRVPLVMLGRHDEQAPYDTVVCDDVLGTMIALEHLRELGHRRIAHLTRSPDVTDPRTHSPHSVRLAQYLAFMERQGLAGEAQVLRTPAPELEAHAVVVSALEAPERPTAIFAGNDELALGAIGALYELNLTSSDVSVVGFDDIDMARHPAISLTTVDQHGEKMGATAATMLLEQIQGRDTPVRHVSQPALRVRSSSAPPSTAG